MRSSVSLRKMLGLTWKKQLWVFALSCLGFFVSCPVYILMVVSSWEGTRHYNLEDRRRLFESMMVSGRDETWILFCLTVAAIGCISAWNGFAYLHGRSKTDFYHALPVRREKLYLLQVITGLINYAVPALAGVVLVGIIAVTHGLTGPGTLPGLALLYVVGAVFYLLLYLTASLAMVLTGRILVGMLGTVVFWGVLPLTLLVAEGYMDMFFTTSLSGMMPRSSALEWSAVGAEMTAIVGRWYGRGHVLTMRALAADGLLFILCGWLHKIRPSQSAEKSMAFKPVGEVILVALSVIAGLTMGLLFRAVEAQEDGWMLFGLLFGTLLVYAIIRMIYHLDLRRIFSGRIQLVMSLVITLAVVGVFRFDLFGFDSYVPPQSAIENIGFGHEAVASNIWSYETDRDIMMNMKLPCTDETYAMLERLVSGHKIYLKTRMDEAAQEGDPHYLSCNQEVYVRLKNGRTYERNFEVYVNDVREQMASLYDIPAFRQQVYGPLSADPEDVVRLFIREPGYTINGEWTSSADTVSVSGKKDKERLLQALTEDVAQMRGKTVLEEPVIGMLLVDTDVSKGLDTFKKDDNGNPIYLGYYAYGEGEEQIYTAPVYVYPSFTNTLSVLDELGSSLSMLQDPTRVKKMEIYPAGSGEDAASTVVRDPEKIREMLAKFCPDTFSGMWQWGADYAQVTIGLEDGEEAVYYGMIMP